MRVSVAVAETGAPVDALITVYSLLSAERPACNDLVTAVKRNAQDALLRGSHTQRLTETLLFSLTLLVRLVVYRTTSTTVLPL